MPAPRHDRIFAALDVGSSKVCALIAAQGEDGKLTVLGTGQRESRGVKRGYIASVKEIEMSIRNAVEQAERIAGVNIDEVHVGFASGGLESSLASVELELGGHRIEEDDIEHLLSAGRASIDARGKAMLHAQPALYTLDGLNRVLDPRGLHADRFGVDIHVVLADPSPVRNMEMAVAAAHLGVAGIVASPIAAGLACLTAEERELGVALVELGAQVTNVSLYAGGMLVALATIPYGGADITDDIASAFGVFRAPAERLKCRYGSAQASPRDNHDMIDLDAKERVDGEPGRISRAQLIAVVRQRLDHLTGEIGRVLKELGFLGPVGRQVVLTGGGADMKGLADYAQAALGRAVRVGHPIGLSALPEAHGGPAFTTLAGLALHAAAAPVDLGARMPDQVEHRFVAPALVRRIAQAIKGNF